MKTIDSEELNAIPEDPARLLILEPSERSVIDLDLALKGLKEDKVLLFRDLDAEGADAALRRIAGAFGLLERLELQAAFAGMLRHRDRVGRYRMTVNARSSYNFIPPHSEGDSFSAMQLASFFCSENSTDGGVTVLVSIDDSSPSWPSLREQVTRLPRTARLLKAGELRRIIPMYHLHDPACVQDNDVVLGERQSVIPGLAVLDVLAVPRRARSVILERELYSYWDAIASVDRSGAPAHLRVLRDGGLLKEPIGSDPAKLDGTASRRIWSSGVDHETLFRCKITRKLSRGDLVVMNNLTWAHSATNWTPESGVRNVSAAFA